MKHRYSWLFPALLTWQLVACSTDQSSERNAARRPAGKQPSAGYSLAKPPAATDYGTASDSAESLSAAESSGAAGRQQKGSQPTPPIPESRPVHRAAKLPMPRPTTLANAAADVIADSLDGIDTLTPTATKLPGSLDNFLFSGLSATQEFTVRPGRDTLLIGRQGTRLFVPADAWEVPLASGPVRVQLREFYSMPDIILAGLGTRAGSELLETGGMLHVAASSATGAPVALRPGKRLGLRMPATVLKPGMRLFRGESTGQRSPNWVLDSLAREATNASSPHAGATRRRRYKYERARRLPADKWPVYALGNKRLNRTILEGTRYQVSTVAQLRRNHNRSDEERAAVKNYNRTDRSRQTGRIRRYAAVEFVVDTTGKVVSPKVRPGCDADLAAPVLAVVNKLQIWKPARYAQLVPGKDGRQPQLRWRPKPAVGIVEVAITPAGAILVSPTWDENATFGLMVLEQTKQQTARYLAKLAAQVARRDSILRNGGQLSAADLAEPTGESLFYELGNIGLGWANCDRFIRSPQPLVKFAVKTPAQNAQVMLVFQDLRCIVRGYTIENTANVLFDKLPNGANVTIVAIKWEQGKAMLAVSPTTISARPYASALAYRPVTMLELQTALAKL